tara:strand:- start:4851 stop:5468 length:618 start_codon:yes stop_codon:yes gene_type:complete
MNNNWDWQGVYDQLTFEQLMNQARRGKQSVGQVLRHTFPQTGARIGGSGLVAMGSRRIPLIAGGLQALTGDPVGGLGTAGGGVAGAMIGQALIPIPGVGAVVGGLVGSQVGQGITRGAQRLAGNVVGIDPTDPLSGPDWNLGGIALTPYAKTKKRTKRGLEIANMQLPLYNEIANKELERKMKRDSLQQTSQIVSNIYSSNPYMR